MILWSGLLKNIFWMWSLNEIRKLINFSTWSVYPQPGCWWRSTNTWSSTSTIEWTGRPTQALHKGWMNRLYFLRMLRSFSLCSKMLEIFSVCCNGGSLKCAGWAASELVTSKDGINWLERLALCLHFGCQSVCTLGANWTHLKRLWQKDYQRDCYLTWIILTTLLTGQAVELLH